MTNITVTTTVTTTEAPAPVRTFQSTIGDIPAICCDGRELHGYLKNGELFATWIKARIEKYGFEEGKDFELALEISKARHGGHNRTDYRLSLNMAKELSMVENNAQGKTARLYFLECERRAMAAAGKSIHEYSIHAGQTLSEEQTQTLRVMLDDAVKGLPKDKQGAFMMQGWAKLKAHFGVGYRQIPAAQFHDAVSLLSRHIVAFVTLPAPAPAQAPAPERISARDMQAIQRVISLASHHMYNRNAWTQGIWFYLRRALDNPAPNPWTVEHLPRIRQELTTMLCTTLAVEDMCRAAQRRAVTRIFRHGDVAEKVLADLQADLQTVPTLPDLPSWLSMDITAITDRSKQMHMGVNYGSAERLAMH